MMTLVQVALVLKLAQKRLVNKFKLDSLFRAIQFFIDRKAIKITGRRLIKYKFLNNKFYASKILINNIYKVS